MLFKNNLTERVNLVQYLLCFVNNERIFIGLGSNKGERRRNIERGIQCVDRKSELEVRVRSDVIETEPHEVDHDRRFLNAVVECRSDLDPAALLSTLQSIEDELGRKHRGQKKPRIIDLDLLYYGKRTINTADLTLPHPRIQERFFVLKPLSQIAPDFVHPVRKQTNQELLNSLERSSNSDKTQQ